MKRVSFTLAICCLVLAGCKPATEPLPRSPLSQPAAEKPEKAFDSATPPTRKQVIRALLEIQAVDLAGIPSCSGVGTEQTDVNIGDYVSGFLAEQGSAKGGNSIEVSTREDQDADHQRAWLSEVVIRHLDGDDRWGWGVSFLMRPANHTVIKQSIQCTGAG